MGDPAGPRRDQAQSLGVRDEILFARQFKDQAHVKSAGGNEGVLHANTTACRIGGISFDFPTGQTLTKVEVGKGDRTATSGITDGRRRRRCRVATVHTDVTWRSNSGHVRSTWHR